MEREPAAYEQPIEKYPDRPSALSDSQSEVMAKIRDVITNGSRRASEAADEQSQGLLGLLAQLNAEVDLRLQRIEDSLASIHEKLSETARLKEWYSTSEAAEALGKSDYTVREWCRLGRVNAHKRPCGRGTSQEWIISHDEIERIRNKGLLPQGL